MQGLYVLLSIMALTLAPAGQADHFETLEIRLHSGTPVEERGRDQLRRLLHTHDVRKWLFTRDVLIQSGMIPHSHPVLTLITRYLGDDTAQLATFVHEQIHWFLTDHLERVKTDAGAHRVTCALPYRPDRTPHRSE